MGVIVGVCCNYGMSIKPADIEDMEILYFYMILRTTKENADKARHNN